MLAVDDEGDQHSWAGGNQRGEATRRRILEIAIEAFARDGFDAVSTRELARLAGVNLPAIRYYFGSKEGLYKAAARHIVGEIEALMAPVADRVHIALAGAPSRGELLALLGELTDAFVAMAFSGGEMASRRAFFARAELDGGPALDMVHENAMQRVLVPCKALVARLLGREEDEDVALRALMILGQVVILCNPRAQGTLGWTSMPRGRMEAVQAVARELATASFRDGRPS